MHRLILSLLLLVNLSAFAQDAKLSGTPIGSSSTKAYSIDKAFDGDPATYYASSSSSMTYVGLDLGTQHVITKIIYQPRQTDQGGNQMLLGIFEGANQPDFMDAVPLHIVEYTPEVKTPTSARVSVTRGFRYIRYVGPAGQKSQVAELEFYGHEGEGDDSHFYQLTKIPTVSIHVANNRIPNNKGEDIDSHITIIYEGGALIQEYPILTRVRGNFSASHENKPYRIKFNDGKSHHMLKGSAKDESPAKAKKWTLINNYGDKTLIRNNVAFEISRRVGLPFTPYCRNVDVMLNGEYRGCYQLTDWLGTDPNRVDIDEMDETDTEDENLTGGYFIEMNGYAGSDPVHFTSSKGNPVTVHSPEDDKIQPEQFNYIYNHFNKMEELLYSPNYTDPEEGYRKMLDLETFLQYFLAEEFISNTDMIWQVFMWKKRGDDHIYTGPVWDHDLGLENDGNYYPGNQQRDWTYKVRGAGNWRSFVSRVLSDPNAMGRLQDMWAELRDSARFDKDDIEHWVDSLRNQVYLSARLNHIRWPYLFQQIHCNPKVYNSWDEEVDNVRDFAGGRVAWMDKMLSYNMLAQEDGIYQISTPRDLMRFIKVVKEGELNAKAVLLADLDMSEYSETFTPIGDSEHIFKGEFDGRNHRICNLNVKGGFYTGFFGVIGEGATISNLTIDASCSFEGSKYVAAIAGMVRGSGKVTINNCANESTILCSGSNAAGLVGGTTTATVYISNSYNVGSISGTSLSAALIGSSYKADIQNCYNIGSVAGTTAGAEFAAAKTVTMQNCYDTQSDQATRITTEQVLSGELCYTMNVASGNQTWRQNIDNNKVFDAYPVTLRTHGIVYQTEEGYTNINPNVRGYRYYKFEISEAQGGDWVQFSEIALLDGSGNEIDDIRIYDGTNSDVQHESWPNAHDGDVGTKYCSGLHGPAYFLLDAGTEIEVCGYRIYTANDTESYSDRNPYSWALYGSQTMIEDPLDSGWELLDERIQDPTLCAENYTPYDFNLEATVQDIELKQKTALLNVGETFKLECFVTPSNMTVQAALQWESSNPEVATVDERGYVKAVSLGTCIISVKSGTIPGLHDECTVTVSKIKQEYRYYLLAVEKCQNGSCLQLSEFDLLDQSRQETAGLRLYASECHNFGGEGPENLCDDNVYSKYCGNLSPSAYFFIDAQKAVKPSAYRLYTANDTQGNPGRNPANWKLYGSNTRSSNIKDDCWKLLDERIDDRTMQATNYTPYDFNITYSGGGALSIDDIRELMADGEIVYDLQGRRVTKPTRGIYLVGNRKVLIK